MKLHLHKPTHQNPWSRILPFLRHILPAAVGIIPLVYPAANAQAQLLNEMFTEDASIDSLPLRSLRLDVDAVGFFRDNEYDTEIQNGYSLPGVRLTPHLAFNPLQQINIEAGASMLFFNGANRYPCFAYHDIATWKGNQYQHGCHVLPWVRLQASLKHLDVVLGNIYGGSCHGLITPLYNPEQNLSTDPEMGVQLLLHRQHIALDVWMNWQSYIFETDTHQEAFTVGTTAKILWGRKKPVSFYSPIQLVLQHRGGEQDATNFGVQTICNASAGVGMNWTPATSGFNSLDAQVNALGCYQQAGKLWPFDTGFAMHVGIQTKWMEHLTVGIDYTHIPKQFVSVYGNPFYSTISLKHGGTQINTDGTLSGHYDHQYKGMRNVRLNVGYQYTFAKAYTLGADAEIYSLHSPQKIGVGEVGKLSDVCFSFGVYLRVSPSFLLKKF